MLFTLRFSNFNPKGTAKKKLQIIIMVQAKSSTPFSLNIERVLYMYTFRDDTYNRSGKKRVIFSDAHDSH